ncbi:hypothetical protein [Arthrobacter sp. StoSoilB5]|uniref:hypothetical protein n=1 Tax=Arthrobacter sp. StoSoilB5 TaxID=2830992 RepID=UPI001CC7C9A9|nr:hypothetical protein [Arthrobacter sp. StoSoilB5]
MIRKTTHERFTAVVAPAMETERPNKEAAPAEQDAAWPAVTTIDTAARPSSGSALTPDDWVWLSPNDRVRIQRENEAALAGFIDIVAPDASIFWIWLDEGRGRVALHMDDDVGVWLEAEQA